MSNLSIFHIYTVLIVLYMSASTSSI